MENYIKIYKKYLNEIKKKYNRNIEKILNIIFETHSHFTHDQLKSKIDFKINNKQLEEILEDIAASGLIRKIFYKNNIFYEQIYGHTHHDHLICIKCNKIIPFKDEIIEKEQKRIVKENEFELLKHSLLITGICKDCLTEDKKNKKYIYQKEDKEIDKNEIIPLSMINAGERAKIKKVEGGYHFVHRLISMGLKTGDIIEVVSNNLHGPFLVKVKETRLGLGYGMTHKIFVKRQN